jgi:hypothetical protein
MQKENKARGYIESSDNALVTMKRKRRDQLFIPFPSIRILKTISLIIAEVVAKQHTLSTHRTQPLGSLQVNPGHQTMLYGISAARSTGLHSSYHMKRVVTSSLHYNHHSRHAERGDRSSELTQGTVIAGEFAGRTSAIELNTTDTTDFIFRNIPVPSSDSIPFFYGDLHSEVIVEEKNIEVEVDNTINTIIDKTPITRLRRFSALTQ